MPPDAEKGPVVTPVPARLTLPLDADEIERRVRQLFKVYEVERGLRGVTVEEILQFYIQLDPTTFNEKYAALRDSVREVDATLVVMHYRRMGEDRILVARRPPLRRQRPGVNILLFLTTVLTTTIAGAILYTGFRQVEDLWFWGEDYDASAFHWRMMLAGFLTFCLPVILILGIHELGHYFVARRHGVRTSLPYFIPVPPIFFTFGTFGAFISMKEPIPDRKALFDIGVSGPLAGFIIAIPVLMLGTVLTAQAAVLVPPEPEMHFSLEVEEAGTTRVFGRGMAESPANATFENATYEEEGKKFTRETIRLNLTGLGWQSPNATNATANRTANWTFVFMSSGLEDVQEVRVAEWYVYVGNMTEWSSGEGRDTEFEYRPLAADHNLTFTPRLNATAAVFTLVWEKPPRGLVNLGDSLLYYGLRYVIDVFIPTKGDLMSHPTAIAGWVGLLVTGFNLLPAGTLDGGHVSRAVFGERSRWVSYAAVALMAGLSFKFAGWLLMALLIVFLGLNHPPPLNDRSELDNKRRVVAFVTLVLLAVTFVPFPLQPL